jgi:hypothetical protein
MTRTQILILAGCLIFCSGILLTLYAISPISKEIYRASFERKFVLEPALQEKAVLDIEYNSFYFAGNSRDEIYLGNSTAPFHLLAVDTSLTNPEHTRLSIAGVDSVMDIERFKLTVQPPYFYLMHGQMPLILRGDMGKWEARQILPDSGDYFVEAVPMGPSSFALRSYSSFSKSYELAGKSETSSFTFKPDLLQKQIDGLFCLDGQMHYNKELKRLVYTHFYRNEFVVADSNMNLVYRGHAIDTFSHARIKVSTVGSENESMLAAPPMQLSVASCVSGKYLFIQSNLLANNEDVGDFIGGAIIDMYDLTNGTYHQSFYINSYKNFRPSDFIVFDNNLAVIYDRYLVLYKISKRVFTPGADIFP